MRTKTFGKVKLIAVSVLAAIAAACGILSVGISGGGSAFAAEQTSVIKNLPTGVSTVTGTIKSVDSNDIRLTTAEKISDGAKKVYFTFYINDADTSKGCNGYVGAVNGTGYADSSEQFFWTTAYINGGTAYDSCLTDCGFRNWVFEPLATGMTHVYEWDLENNTYTVKILKSDGSYYNTEAQYSPSGSGDDLTDLAYPFTQARVYENASEQYFGFKYKPQATSTYYRANVTAAAWDDTGKDLKIAYNGFDFSAADTPVAPSGIEESSISYKAYEGADQVYILSSQKPSAKAKKVTFQFKISEMKTELVAGGRLPWIKIGAANGKFASTGDSVQLYSDTAVLYGGELYLADCMTDYGFYRHATQSLFVKGSTHTFVFDFENNTYSVTVADASGDVVLTTMTAADLAGNNATMPFTRERIYDSPFEQYFGLSLYTEATIDSWSGVFDVKCWDDTGKDLGATVRDYSDGASVKAEKAAETSVLTDFDGSDALLFDKYAGYMNGSKSSNVTSGTFSGLVGFSDATDGASNGVLKYQFKDKNANNAYQVGSVSFGKTLTATDMSDGCLSLRMAASVPDGANLTMYLISLANDKNDISDEAKCVKLIGEGGIANAVIGADGFINVNLTAAQLALLTDEYRNFSGFTIASIREDSGTTPAIVYFDKIVWSKAVTVSFKNADGTHIKTASAVTGYSLSEQGISFPNATLSSSETVFGWSKIKGGTDYFSENSVLNENVTLYALSCVENGDYASLAGVYYNAESGVYFELTADKKVNGYFAAAAFKSYICTNDGSILFDGTVKGNVASAELTVNGVTYSKAADVKTVAFFAEGDKVATVKVPSGAKVTAPSAPEKKFYSFSGWYNGNAAYDFDEAVTSDINLTARFEFNASSNVSAYINAYYDAESGILYNIKENFVCVKVENGQKTTLSYQVSSDGTLITDGKQFTLNGGYMLTSGDSRFVKLWDKYTLTLIDGSSKDTIVLSAQNDYVAEKPADPEKRYYTFKGWKRGDGSAFDFGTVINSNTEIYAAWEYTVTQAANPSSGGCNGNIGVSSLFTVVVALAACTVVVTVKSKKD